MRGCVLWVGGLLLVAALVGGRGGDVYIWITLALVGVWVWRKVSEEAGKHSEEKARKERARAADEERRARQKAEDEARRAREEEQRKSDEKRAAQREVDREAGRWIAAVSPRPWADLKYLKPARIEPEDAGMSPVPTRQHTLPARRDALPTGPVLYLPDVQEARWRCGEIVSALTRSTATEARQLADALGPFLDGGCRSGKFRKRKAGGQGSPSSGEFGPLKAGTRPSPEVADVIFRAMSWADARSRLFDGLHPEAARLMGGAAKFLTDELHRLRGTSYASEPPGEPVRPAGQWESFIQHLHQHLLATAAELTALPAFEPPPATHPPRAARLQEHLVTEALELSITEYVQQQAAALERAATGTFDVSRSTWNHGTELLKGFLTSEVLSRFQRATWGFATVSAWDERTVRPDIRSQLHRAYMAFALNYFREVLENMTEYAKNSGEGGPRNQVTVHGDAVVNIAETLTYIGSTVAAVINRGDTEAAEAINALSAAIQSEPGLTGQRRNELLDNVADIADAVAEPETPRVRSRAKAALAAIGAASGASSQITQALTDWHHVFNGFA
ncbi:hypothetical protein [Streptomyces sp. NPDC046821]|uniref:hypothetical protein n=1 Tax=Streptomyces sp. NPDC046821 TaxID=3154702 RepID=UPI0033C746D2